MQIRFRHSSAPFCEGPTRSGADPIAEEPRTFFLSLFAGEIYEGIRNKTVEWHHLTPPPVVSRLYDCAVQAARTHCARIPLGRRPKYRPAPPAVTGGVPNAAGVLFTFCSALANLPNGSMLGNGEIGSSSLFPPAPPFHFFLATTGSENSSRTRVDHKLSATQSLFGTYMFDKTPYSSPDGAEHVLFASTTPHLDAIFCG